MNDNVAITQDEYKLFNFLKYYVEAVYPCLGPADGEINDSITDSYVRENGELALPQEELEYYRERQENRRRDNEEAAR